MSFSDDFDAPAGHIPHKPGPDAAFVRRLLIAALIVVLLIALWRVSLVFVLIFGGILFAVALRSLSEPLGRMLKVPDRAALAVTILGLAVVIAGFFDLFGTLAAQQFSALIDKIPGAVESARAWLEGSALGREALQAIEGSTDAASHLLSAIPLAGGILGWLGEAVLIVFIGVYFALDPQTYAQGVLRLVPPRRRAHARTVLDAMGLALHKWLIGMALDMLFLGVMTGIGMWLIGAPQPFALAVLSGVAVFVPYIGPLAATIPGLLLALSVKPILALYTGIVYAVVLTIEGNITQPLLQRWAVSLPPVVNLLAILVFSPLFGLWGAVLATPLAVALWVLVKMTYVEEVLERH